MFYVKGLLVAVFMSNALAFASEPQNILSFQDSQGSLFEANLNQTRLYKKSECAEKFVMLLQTYLLGTTVEITTHGETVTLDKSSFQFCGITDLDQGSYDIDRAVSFCADIVNKNGHKFSATVFTKTNGDMFCENETLVSLDGVWVH